MVRVVRSGGWWLLLGNGVCLRHGLVLKPSLVRGIALKQGLCTLVPSTRRTGHPYLNAKWSRAIVRWKAGTGTVAFAAGLQASRNRGVPLFRKVSHNPNCG